MLYVALAFGTLVCGIQALRSRNLLVAAAWLAGASVLTAMLLYALGARELAVIELSVGAGLVTVLFTFAIGIAGGDAREGPAVIPAVLVWGLAGACVLLLAWLALPLINPALAASDAPFATLLWHARGIDLVAQLVLIFVGILGVLSLLSERRA
jgi:NADH:ubiquinone oxidoreductase subunit 6 (subunit J)